MKVSLDHINISVKNYKKTVAFYKEVFGLQEVESGVWTGLDWSILRSGDFMMCIYDSAKKDALDEVLKVNHFGIRVQDEKPILKKLYDLGVIIEPQNIIRYKHSKSWYVTDPSGHGIEIVKWDDDIVKFD